MQEGGTCMCFNTGLPSSIKFWDTLSIAQLSCCHLCLLAVPTLSAVDLSNACDVRDAGSGHRRDKEAAVFS